MIVYTRGRVAELGSGLPRDGRRASSPTSRSSCWRTATARARRRSSPARCRITIAPTSSARRRSARRWCSRSTASAAAPGLALTTAHYYTPSGPLIQRPWDASFDEYLSYTLRDQDANKPHNPSDLKHTDAGRPVYSGGGIEPDKRVAGPLEGFNPARFGRMLVRARRVRQLRAEVRRRRRHARHAGSRPAASSSSATSSSTTRWWPTSASS